MPRLSLYRPHKSADYNFLDRIIQEEFSVGGVDVNIHKYLGPKTPEAGTATADQPVYDVVNEATIQDLLFLENRDRKYDIDIYTIRGVYTLIDNDFNLNQFGIFLANDVIYMTVHINYSVKTIGRKIMAGDVVELPHLKDEYALNDLSTALKRYYVVEEVTRPSEGFSQTWYPHLYRMKLKQIYNSQEYKDIFDMPVEEGSTQTLGDVLSTYQKEIEINDAILAQANSDSKLSGYDTSHYYTLQLADDGKSELVEVNGTFKNQTPDRSGYSGYLLGDGLPPNGEAFGHGISFPLNMKKGDYFLRTDFMPNRLFRYDGTRWTKIEDSVRHTLNNGPNRMTQKGSFINNTNTNEICGEVVEERQSLSKALRPQADN